MRVICIRTSIDGKLPVFRVIKCLSSRIGRTTRHMQSTIQGSNLRFPTGHIIVGLSPTAVEGEKTSFSLPVTITVLASLNILRRGEEVGSYVVVKRLKLSKRMEGIPKVLSVISRTGTQGIADYVIPERGRGRTRLMRKVQVVTIKDLERYVDCLRRKGEANKRRFNRGRPSGVRSEKGQKRRMPSFTSLCNRRGIHQTTRVTITKKRGLLVIKPPKDKGAVATGYVTKVLPPVGCRRDVRLAGLCDIVKVLSNGRPLVSEEPFQRMRRATAETTLVKKKVIPEPKRVDLTRDNVLFVSRLPRFGEDILRILERPLRRHDVRVAEADKGCVFPTSFVLISTVGAYPYKGFPSATYDYAPTRVRTCLDGVDRPFLSQVSLDIRTSGIRCQSLIGRSISYPRSSTIVGTQIYRTEGERGVHCGGAGVRYGTVLRNTRLDGCYELGKRRVQLVKRTCSMLGLATESCRHVLGITEAVTSLSRDRRVGLRRLRRTVNCQALSGGC